MSSMRPELPWRALSGDRPRLPAAHPVNTMGHESLFNRLERRSLFEPTDGEDICSALDEAMLSRNPLLAQPMMDGAGKWQGRPERLLKCLELDLGRLQGMTADPFLSADDKVHDGPWPICKTLRWCPACLALGYHTMLYQHLAVTVCPYHHLQLQDVCSGCGRLWKLDSRERLRDPYCCTGCGRLHFRTVEPKDAARQIDEAASAVGMLWSDLDLPCRIRNERAAVRLLLQPGYSHEAQRTRAVQRVTAWPRVPQKKAWNWFQEEQGIVYETLEDIHAPSRQTTWDEVEKDPTTMLRLLGKLAGASLDQSMELVQLSWQRIQYITPQHRDREVGVVATALHMTMCRYGSIPLNYRALQQSPSGRQPYAGVRWAGLHSESSPLCFGRWSGRLIALEIAGYFAMCLLGCAGSDAGGDPCTGNFAACSYCPGWLLQYGSRSRTLRIRPRATEKLITRLVHRYQNTPLQRVAVCQRLSSPRIPALEQLHAVKFPAELIHFPRAAPYSAPYEERDATPPAILSRWNGPCTRRSRRPGTG